ncbi:putative GTPase [Actinocorallia herbida]|uniref:Putative GTPase n=1 Tax=Actinocorallia herbida TaxID=58109 RepID=A0A3N1DBN7_9ACTN|nr:putative GTPase [Actinocorallia herbida]
MPSAVLEPSAAICANGVVIAGLFSAKRKDHGEVMDALAAEVTGLGGSVVGRFVQRRGISGHRKGGSSGGKANMDRPYSSRMLMTSGKVREIATCLAQTDAGAVVFANELTGRQRRALTRSLGCPVFSGRDLSVSTTPTGNRTGSRRPSRTGPSE